MELENWQEILINQLNWPKLQKLRSKLNEAKHAALWQKIMEDSNQLPSFKTSHLILHQSVVEIGHLDEFSQKEHELFLKVLKYFIPWKKGPFKLFGHEIDAEWRSDLKWDRIAARMRPLKDKIVADIGCHNGYFMFRMAAHEPKLVIGFEPYAKHWHAFSLMQRYANLPNLCFELLGIEHIHLFPQFFDTVFCLGILYHHTDPIGLLSKIYSSLKKGGELIVDCQGIAGEMPVALTPQGRYAKARGIWFLPTISALQIWLKRARFQKIECFYDEPLTSLEQRTTTWAPIPSLRDFLHPDDSSLTVEGYPAPRRFYVKAIKP